MPSGGVLRFRPGPVIIQGVLAPFTAPLSDEWRTDPFAWRGGKHRRPTWLSAGIHDLQLDTAGVHALLRAACLPRVELLHMGALEADLAPDAPMWLPESRVVSLLGRIVVDSSLHRDGGYWAPLYDGVGHSYGRQVIEEWFHA